MSASEDIALIRSALKLSDYQESGNTLQALARLEQRVDAGEPGEGVRRKPDVAEAGEQPRFGNGLSCTCSGGIANGCLWHDSSRCPVHGPTSTTPPEAAPVPGSPDLASLVSSLTRERDEAQRQLETWRDSSQVRYERAEAAEDQVAVLRQAVTAYAKFDDVIAMLSDARHAQYQELREAVAAVVVEETP